MSLSKINVKIQGGYDIKFPKMVKIKQHFKRERINNIEMKIYQEMKDKLSPQMFENKRIAITAGSRGIASIVYILKAVIKQLKNWGAKPFIVPAMGSHGGATSEGQKDLLKSYGITEKSMGIPILSSMDVVQVASLDNGMPIYCDKNAIEADGIVVINKIKPHADFKGKYESGLLKMMAIGLGKHKGAAILHTYGFDKFDDIIPKVGKVLLDNTSVIFGLAILENAYEEIKKLEIIPKEKIMEREQELLEEAKESMAKILFPYIDVLIVEEIGKNISGEGMDPNVTGRPGSKIFGFIAPKIQKIIVLSLTEESHGNASGIGMADISTIRCINQINFETMYTNSITTTILDPAKIPIIMNNDKEALIIALKTCNRVKLSEAKIIRIKNTSYLHDIQVSEAYLDEIKGRDDISILSKSEPIRFREDGWLI